MAIALLGLRLVLAVVFGVAAVGKLRALGAFAASLEGFGLPRALHRPIGVLVPVAEALAAALLLVPGTATAGALIAAVLLVVFSLSIVSVLMRGAHLDCACFGAASAEPVDGWALARNVVLLAMALAVWTATQAADMTSPDTALGAGVAILSAIVAAAAWESSRLRAANQALQQRVTTLEAQRRADAAAPRPQIDLDAGGLAVGTPAPPFDLPKLEGDRASLASLVAGGRHVALVFVSAHCSVCHQLWPDIERWQAREDGCAVAVVASGSEQTLEMKLMGHAVTTVLLEGDARVADAYALGLKPSAVLVGPDGRIATPSAAGVAAVRTLVENALRRQEAEGSRQR